MTDAAGLKAFFLVGATATGKTAVAQRIAEQDGFDIVSADSMLVYRGMDIGTAKPTREQQSRVRYWCIDIADPGSSFSVGLFRKAAVSALSAVAAAGRQAVVCGGTGLYIKALTHGLSPAPPADNRLRAELDELLKEKPVEELQAMLMKEAPELYESLGDNRNPRRLIRALELARAGVRKPSGHWKAEGTGAVLTGLRISPVHLQKKIERRVRDMYRDGLLNEVRTLLTAGFGESPTAHVAIGYAEAIAVIEKRSTVEEAVRLTVHRTVQLAKRQMTWFRHQSRVDWIDMEPGADLDSVCAAIRTSWSQHGPVKIAV